MPGLLKADVLDAFSHRKSVLRKPVRPDLKLLYPPYKPRVARLVRKIIR